MKRPVTIALSLMMVLGFVLAACAPAATPVAPIKETVVVQVTQPPQVVTKEVVKEVQVTPTPAPVTAGTLPRNETLYFNGQQWGAVVGWNPYSNSNNNALAIAQQDNARVIMFETPYLYNMLDGKVYPLLADGPFAWNDAKTEISFKIKSAAKWSDGTPVTAEDVAYTWATHIKYNTPTGAANKDYIEDIVAKDAQTVVIKAKLGEDGKAINPLLVNAYVSTNYVNQKAWTQKLEERVGGDATKLLADPAEDVVYSGPYHKFFADESKVVYERDDNYWGQDKSMWGKLPVPKYLAHTIFKDNAAGSVALAKGEVDVSQQFNSNIQTLWLNYGLPISTYLPDAPYGIGASLPTAFFNLKSPGLDQVAVRKAIAIAVDYPTIIANAMTNQSATFDQVPRSLMNPTAGEQALYDHDAVKDLLLKCGPEDTTVTGRFTGFPMRCLANEFTRQFHQAEIKRGYEMLNFGAGKINAGLMEGDVANGSLPAGQVIGQITKRQSAADIMDGIVTEAETLTRRIIGNKGFNGWS